VRHGRSELRDRDLVLGKDLEQQSLGLELEPVDLVNQKYYASSDRMASSRVW